MSMVVLMWWIDKPGVCSECVFGWESGGGCESYVVGSVLMLCYDVLLRYSAVLLCRVESGLMGRAKVQQKW
jgi:hypothetical protein